MNDNSNDIRLKVALSIIAAYLAYKAGEKIVAAIAAFLQGLVVIALIAAGVFIAYWLYRHITERQYGDDRRMRQIQKLEEQRIRAVGEAPEHMRDGIDEWYRQRQQAKYQEQGQSRFDLFADRTKQIFSLWRDK